MSRLCVPTSRYDGCQPSQLPCPSTRLSRIFYGSLWRTDSSGLCRVEPGVRWDSILPCVSTRATRVAVAHHQVMLILGLHRRSVGYPHRQFASSFCVRLHLAHICSVDRQFTECLLLYLSEIFVSLAPFLKTFCMDNSTAP